MHGTYIKNIYTRLKMCSAYADDILINTTTKQLVICTFKKLKISE